MKTVCPNCHQKYDVPDDYLQQEVSCEKCQHDFIVTKAKFCLECGTPNPAQQFECWKCNAKFEQAPVKAAATQLRLKPTALPPQSYPQAPNIIEDRYERISSVESLSSWERKFINLSWGFPVLIMALFWLFIIFALLLKGDPHRQLPSTNTLILLAVAGIPASVVLVTVAKAFIRLSNPSRKIYWTAFRKICVWSYATCIFPLMLISMAVSIIQHSLNIGKVIGLFGVLVAIYSLIFAWKFFNIRAEEDTDMEEADTVPESPHGPLLGRISGAVGVVSLICPPLGIVAIILGIIALCKKQKKGWYGIILGCVSMIGASIIIYLSNT